MAGSVRETKWVVTVDGNAKQASAETVEALKKMAAEYETNKKGLDQLNSALKASGKGNAEVTKKIKEQIEKITARQAVVTADAAKHGQSVKTIIKNAQKEAAEREKAAKKIAAAEKARAAAQTKAFSLLGGKLGALRNKLIEYKDVASEEGGKGALFKAALMGAGEAAASLGVAAAAAGVAISVGLAAGIAAATLSLTKWVVLTASSRQQTRLQMEAWVRTGQNAQNLADQVDELGKKVPTSTEELSKLAISLRQAGIRGAPLVDSLNAIGQASSALGNEAGAKLQEFITRYQRMGVMQINPFEMINSGLDFDDVAGALAKQTGISIDKARAALATGRVKLGDGAKAMRKAIEDKFSGINLRKLSDLSTVSDQFGKRLSALAPGEKALAPISRFLDRIYKSLDESSWAGQGLKTLFETLATAFGTSLDKNGDWIEYGLKEAIIWSLKLSLEMITVKDKIEDAFNDGRSAAEKFNSILNVITSSLKLVAGASIAVFAPTQGTKWFGEGAAGLAKAASGAVSSLSSDPKTLPAHAMGGLVTSVTRGIAETTRLPAHATGGMVKGVSGGIADTAPLPANGEGLASVGVGEMIVPAGDVRAPGASNTVHVGDVHVQSGSAEPREIARAAAEEVFEKILAAFSVTSAQVALR